MTFETFREDFLPYLNVMRTKILDEHGDLALKGLIDSRQTIYPLSADTKLLSKVIELLLMPVIEEFADAHHYMIQPANAQNQYPDITLLHRENASDCVALDIKTTYRALPDKQGRLRVNGMTLGSYMGYFRTRHKPDKSTLAYDRYQKHFVLGLVYARKTLPDSKIVYQLDDLLHIPAIIGDVELFLQEKYRIASDMKGSGNTRNIGSTRLLASLVEGQGVFADLGVGVFDDYWQNYPDPKPRTMIYNLKTYLESKKQQGLSPDISMDEVDTDDEE